MQLSDSRYHYQSSVCCCLSRNRLRNKLNGLYHNRSHLFSFALRVASLDLCLRTLDLGHQELDSLVGTDTVGQVSRQNQQSTHADGVPRLTDDLDLVLGKVGNLAFVLDFLSVAVQNNTGNLVLDSLVELLNGAVVNGGTLAVARSYNDRIGALLGHGVERVLEEFLGPRISATGKGVCAH